MSNKIIWITGAGTGIGLALVNEYNTADNTIILSGRKREALDRVAENIHNPFVLPLDVTSEDDIAKAVKTVGDKFDRIDILINNAGVSQRSSVTEVTNKVGRDLIEVNFFGSIHLTKAALPLLLKSKRSTVVTMSSAAGKFGFPLRTYYSASKHALHGWYESLSMEMDKTPLNVLIVCPGRIKTDISKNALNGDGTAHNQMDDGQRFGYPVDKCARKITNAIKRGKREVYIGGKEVVMIYFKRYIPALFWTIITKVNPK